MSDDGFDWFDSHDDDGSGSDDGGGFFGGFFGGRDDDGDHDSGGDGGFLGGFFGGRDNDGDNDHGGDGGFFGRIFGDGDNNDSGDTGFFGRIFGERSDSDEGSNDTDDHPDENRERDDDYPSQTDLMKLALLSGAFSAADKVSDWVRSRSDRDDEPRPTHRADEPRDEHRADESRVEHWPDEPRAVSKVEPAERQVLRPAPGRAEAAAFTKAVERAAKGLVERAQKAAEDLKQNSVVRPATTPSSAAAPTPPQTPTATPSVSRAAAVPPAQPQPPVVPPAAPVINYTVVVQQPAYQPVTPVQPPVAPSAQQAMPQGWATAMPAAPQQPWGPASNGAQRAAWGAGSENMPTPITLRRVRAQLRVAGIPMGSLEVQEDIRNAGVLVVNGDISPRQGAPSLSIHDRAGHRIARVAGVRGAGREEPDVVRRLTDSRGTDMYTVTARLEFPTGCDVVRADGARLGGIVQARTGPEVFPRWGMFLGNALCGELIPEDQQWRTMRIEDAQGLEIARVVWTPAGLLDGKLVGTDGFVLQIKPFITGALRDLVITSVLGVDMVRR